MDLMLDNTGDIQVVDGEVELVTGISAISQHLLIRLRTFRAEWFLDNREGVPYFGEVFKKNPDLTVLNTVFTKVITDTPGVTTLNELSFSLQPDRTFEVAFRASTVEGEVNLTISVGV